MGAAGKVIQTWVWLAKPDRLKGTIMSAAAGIVSLPTAVPGIPSQVLGSGLIGLREGLEAGIVVVILVAFLVKSGRRDALKWVWLGVAGAVGITIGVFLSIQFTAYTISGLGAEAIAGIASLAAVL